MVFRLANFWLVRLWRLWIILLAVAPACVFANALAPVASDVVSGTASELPRSFTESVAFVTLRNKTGRNEVAEYFGGGRDILRTGFCDVTRTPVPMLKTLADNVPFYVPDDILKIERIREFSAPHFWESISQTAGNKSLVLYTHGFNIDFQRGCKRASEFQRSLGLGGRLILFSWPSDGLLVNYTADEADIYWSVDPLQMLLRGIVESMGRARFSIVAHSLGSRGVMLALLRMAESSDLPGRGPLFDQLVFLAPDIDAEIFSQHLSKIRPLVKNITLYVSDHDHPLALSNQLHGYPRLGEVGAHLKGLEGVEIIDVSDVPVQYPSGHLYHLYNEHVKSDLDQLLNNNKTAEKRVNLKNSGVNYWRLQTAPVDTENATGER